MSTFSTNLSPLMILDVRCLKQLLTGLFLLSYKYFNQFFYTSVVFQGATYFVGTVYMKGILIKYNVLKNEMCYIVQVLLQYAVIAMPPT